MSGGGDGNGFDVTDSGDVGDVITSYDFRDAG